MIIKQRKKNWNPQKDMKKRRDERDEEEEH